MPSIDIIVTYILTIAPAVIAVLTALCTLIKILGAFKDLRKEVQDKTEMREIQEDFKQVLHENYALKKSINELVEKIDKVRK